MTAIDLSKQQILDADPKAIQQINFTANLGRAGNTTIFFVIEGAKEIFHCRFFPMNCESIVNVVLQRSYCMFHNIIFF